MKVRYKETGYISGGDSFIPSAHGEVLVVARICTSRILTYGLSKSRNGKT